MLITFGKSLRYPTVRRMISDLKIVIAGDRQVGRTKLLVAWQKGQPAENTQLYPTFRPFTQDITHQSKTYKVGFYDTPTEDRVRLRAITYGHAHCVIICFALDNEESLTYVTTVPAEDALINAPPLVKEIRDILGDNVPIILIGSKSDLGRKVERERAIEVQKKIKATSYFEYAHDNWDSMKAILTEAVDLAAKYAETAPAREGKDDDEESTGRPSGSGGGGGGGGAKEQSCCVVL